MPAEIQQRADMGAQNLKDLISGPGVDKELSAPLSIADLHSCLDRIKLLSEDVKDRVYHTVSTHYRSFLEITTNASDTCQDVSLISSELNAALKLLEGQADGKNGDTQESGSGSRTGRPKGLNGADLAVCRAAEEAHKLEGAIRDRDRAKAIIASVIQVQALLAEGDSWLATGDYLQAAKRISYLKEQLFSHEEEEGAAPVPVILQGLQQAWQSRYEKLKSQLEWLSTQAIGLDPKQFQLRVTAHLPAGTSRAGSGFASTSATTLPQIFDAMEALGILELRVAKLSDAIFSCILNPLLRDPSLGVEEGESADDRQVAGIRAVASEHTGGTKEASTPQLLYPKLLQVSRFLLRHVAGGDARRMSGIGRTLWPRLADGIIATCLTKAIPNQTSQLEQFRAVADLTLQTEEALKSMALIPPQAAEGRGDRLTTFAANVEIHFAAKRKNNVLGDARKLMVDMDFTSLQVGTEPDSDASRGEGGEDGEDGEEGPVFLFESCHVTQAAQGLLHLVHAALQEACLSTPRAATSLYVAAREALTLYRAILPAMHGEVLSTDPVKGLLHSNDCLFIAHELLTLGLQYRAVLKKQLGTPPLFVDLVPLFRQMAEEGCNRVLRHQHLHIKESLRKGGEFVNTDDPTHYLEAHAAVNEAVDHLESVALLWQPLAGGRRFHQLVAHLAEDVLYRVVGKVVAIRDMAATETQALQRLVGGVLARLHSLLPPSVLELVVPSYRKAVRLGDILDMSLLAITQAWQSGDLVVCGFSRQEVCSLVEAIFTETQQRRECLQRIAISL